MVEDKRVIYGLLGASALIISAALLSYLNGGGKKNGALKHKSNYVYAQWRRDKAKEEGCSHELISQQYYD